MRDAQRVRDARDDAEADAPSTTLPNGLRYREYVAGEVGEEAMKGSRVDARYKVFRLSSGAYFKYSSGGTPVLLWSRGYGAEGRDDVGETVSFVLGETPLPRAVTPCVVGMKKGSVRRILVPPNLGWVNDDVVPRPRLALVLRPQAGVPVPHASSTWCSRGDQAYRLVVVLAQQGHNEAWPSSAASSSGNVILRWGQHGTLDGVELALAERQLENVEPDPPPDAERAHRRVAPPPGDRRAIKI